jgi:hypothetical protein
MSYNSLQPLGDNYIAVTFWALATLHGQSFYPEIMIFASMRKIRIE